DRIAQNFCQRLGICHPSTVPKQVSSEAGLSSNRLITGNKKTGLDRSGEVDNNANCVMELASSFLQLTEGGASTLG
ncbi:MAG TPA: hypothetical protein V6D06_12500, partial [Trichocoleus sp.]